MAAASYLTVAEDADAEIEVKRSRFLARIRRVGAEADARAVIEGCRKEFWDARHHCSAYVVGPLADLTYGEVATLTVGVPQGLLDELAAVLAGDGEYAVTGEVWTDEPATSH